ERGRAEVLGGDLEVGGAHGQVELLVDVRIRKPVGVVDVLGADQRAVVEPVDLAGVVAAPTEHHRLMRCHRERGTAFHPLRGSVDADGGELVGYRYRQPLPVQVRCPVGDAQLGAYTVLLDDAVTVEVLPAAVGEDSTGTLEVAVLDSCIRIAYRQAVGGRE